MKKLKIIFILSAFCSIWSCGDATDIQQPGNINPELTFKNMDGFRKNLVGLYGSIPYENAIAFTSVFTDEVAIGIANGGQGLTDGRYGYVLNSNSDDANSIWYSNYRCINSCNRIILGSETVVHTDDELEEFNSIIAQAKAIRAFCYLQLEAYFSTDMTDDNALGVILFTDAPDFSASGLPRSKNSQIFALMNDDLSFAEANLSQTPPFQTGASTGVPTYVTQKFVTAVRARLALYRGDYTNALIYAESLISSGTLTNAANYPKIWNVNESGYAGEVIFKIEKSINDSKIGTTWASVSVRRSGSPIYEMSRSLFNKFPLPNSISASFDIRKKTFVNLAASAGELNSPGSLVSPDYQNDPNYIENDVLLIAKYPGSEGYRLLNDIKVFRLSEMYFIKAECQIKAGDLVGAAATITAVRKARRISGNPPPLTYANETEAWVDVLLERRIELCYEGHRYIDMKRLGVKANVSFERDPRDCSINQSCFFSNTDHRLTLPIPSAELGANPAIVGQQNPRY